MKTKKRNKKVTIKKINKRKIKPEIINFIFELAQEKNVPNSPSVSDSKIAHIGIGRSLSKK